MREVSSSYFYDKNCNNFINFIAPDEVLGKTASLKPLHVAFDNGEVSDTESLLKKNQRRL